MGSDSGLPGCTWGPALWHSLHAMSFGYPENVGNSLKDQKLKQDTFLFFEYLGSVLPCSECREHYSKNFKNYDLSQSLDSRMNFARWVYDLHNRVNKGTGVPESSWPSFEEVYNKYNNIRSENCSELPGVCGSSVSNVYCKVSLVPKSEMFSNESTSFDSSWVLSIVLGIALLSIVAYYLYCLKNNKSTKNTKRKRR